MQVALMGRISFIFELLKPWSIRILLFLFAAIELYDAAANQFSWPKIPVLLGMTPSLKPWWAWILAIIVFALFEYVRTKLDPDTINSIQAASAGVKIRKERAKVIPDMTLYEVALRVIDSLGPKFESNSNKQQDRIVNLEIADKIKQHGATVWVRHGDLPLQELDAYRWEYAVVDARSGSISIPSDWHATKYTDVKFSHVEIDRIWPPSG